MASTCNYSVHDGAQGRHPGFISSAVSDSDSFATSTTATFVENGGTDITVNAGQIFRVTVDEDMWIAFGGKVATVGNDIFLEANVEAHIECAATGKVSIIEVA